MSYRLSKIVTRTGDDSTTGLGDGKRIGKDNIRIAVIGDVDELNSQIGMLLTEQISDDIRSSLIRIQHDLFDLGSELSIPGNIVLSDLHLERLDNWFSDYNSILPKLREFILPGGSRGAAIAHVCRTVCRRAERSLVLLLHQDKIKSDEDQMIRLNNIAQKYLNRLSDLLFVFARTLNHVNGNLDVFWTCYNQIDR
ncbi:MAG: cob(I)yrinic acid a,c-diamide adenosyltransferase [Burkholderia sp.]|nr:cob(I)yrinic acid a,c-diamide adenosyltransferase [Burkholderia sp.]